MPLKTRLRRAAPTVLIALGLALASLAVPRPSWGTSGPAGTSEDASQDEAAKGEADAYGRDNPRAMLIGLFEALTANDLPRLVHYMEGEQAGSPASFQRAARLAEAMDRYGKLKARIALSLDPEGDLDDGLPPDREDIGTLELETGPVPIMARRISASDAPTPRAAPLETATDGADGGQGALWLISRESVEAAIAAAPALAPGDDSALHVKERTMLLGAPLSSWALIAGVGLALFIGIVLAFRALCRLIGLEQAGRAHQPGAEIIMALAPPAALIAVYAAIEHFAAPLGAGLAERTAIARYSGIVVGLAVVWPGWRLTGTLSRIAVWRMRAREQMQWIGPLKFAMRMIRLGLVAYAVATLLATFAIDVTAGLAALGVGGLALALGARKAVEDLVGSILVLSDKPVRVGDLCKVNGHTGHVLDIGLRSTRIRTLDRTILAIPNSHFADGEIENLAVRDRFFVDQYFGIPFSAGSTGIMRTLEAARSVIAANPDYIEETCPIRFLGFGDCSYRFRIHAHLHCDSFADGFYRQERLILAILERLETMGLEVALPAQHLELAGDTGRS